MSGAAIGIASCLPRNAFAAVSPSLDWSQRLVALKGCNPSCDSLKLANLHLRLTESNRPPRLDLVLTALPRSLLDQTKYTRLYTTTR